MRAVIAVLGLLGMLVGATAAGAQGGGRQAQAPADAPVTPAEIQRMFDSYALMQAEQQLQIRDDQFPQFMTRFRALLEIRRRALQQHGRHLNELRRFLNAPQPDESAIRTEMKALDDEDAQAQIDARKAYEAIDLVLDVRQQAKFRVFEENMERRKLELVTRARQANRPKPQL